MQQVGVQLKELQKAMKSPGSNLGLVLSEASKRVFRSVGLSGSSKALSPYVHSSLSEQAGYASVVRMIYEMELIYCVACY